MLIPQISYHRKSQPLCRGIWKPIGLPRRRHSHVGLDYTYNVLWLVLRSALPVDILELSYSPCNRLLYSLP